MSTLLNVAIAQLDMNKDFKASLRALLEAIRRAAAEGAELVVTPELSLTGYHRHVPALCGSAEIVDGVGRIQQACQRSGIAAIFGFPFSDAAGQVLNRVMLVDAQGEVLLEQDKIGLTPSELKLFTPGEVRQVVEFQGWRIAIAMCREMLDFGEFAALAGGVDLLVWPACIQWEGGADDYRGSACEMAKMLGSWVVQSNWSSVVNDPSLRDLGGSVVVSSEGEVLFAAERDEMCCSLLTLSADAGPQDYTGGLAE